MKTEYKPTPGSQVEAVAKLMAKGMDRHQIRKMLNLSNDASWYALKARERKAKAKAKPAKAQKQKVKPIGTQESFLVECIVHAPAGAFRVFAREDDFVETYQRAITAARGAVR